MEKKRKKEANTNIYLGFRSKDFVVLEDEFKNVANNLIITTDDGTYGNSGFAINYLEKDLNEKNIDAIYACGPLPMLKAVKNFAESKNIFLSNILRTKNGLWSRRLYGMFCKTNYRRC